MVDPNEKSDVGASSSKTATMADLQTMMDEIKRLKNENNDFKKRQKPISFSISEKGAVSVSGIGKFPFTMYKSQWDRILEKTDDLKQFMSDNEARLN